MAAALKRFSCDIWTDLPSEHQRWIQSHIHAVVESSAKSRSSSSNPLCFFFNKISGSHLWSLASLGTQRVSKGKSHHLRSAFHVSLQQREFAMYQTLCGRLLPYLERHMFKGSHLLLSWQPSRLGWKMSVGLSHTIAAGWVSKQGQRITNSLIWSAGVV